MDLQGTVFMEGNLPADAEASEGRLSSLQYPLQEIRKGDITALPPRRIQQHRTYMREPLLLPIQQGEGEIAYGR